METDLSYLVGKKVKLTSPMVDEPKPIDVGEVGEVYHTGGGVINVLWENGRSLGLIHGVDQYIVLED